LAEPAGAGTAEERAAVVVAADTTAVAAEVAASMPAPIKTPAAEAAAVRPSLSRAQPT